MVSDRSDRVLARDGTRRRRSSVTGIVDDLEAREGVLAPPAPVRPSPEGNGLTDGPDAVVLMEGVTE
jgi:hypothetical protein